MALKDEILRILRERGEVSTAELAQLAGVPRHRVLRVLNKMYFLGLVEPVKKGRRYYWRLSAGVQVVEPLHSSLEPVVYIEGVVEPIYRKVGNRVDSFMFVPVGTREYWLCEYGGYYIATDAPIEGCDCRLRHAFGERRMAMVYMPRELRFRYWRSYRYQEKGVVFIVLVPEEQDSPALLEKYRQYQEVT